MLVAKPGLDGHDRGAKVIARALRDAGMEVVYTGLRQTPEMIVNAALQEDVQVIGLSILSGAHNAIVPRVMELLKEKQMDDVLVMVGGIVPDEDAAQLKRLGVAAVYPARRLARRNCGIHPQLGPNADGSEGRADWKKENEMQEKLNIAVFVDYDNIEIGLKSTLRREFDVSLALDALKERGDIVAKFAYANWGRQDGATRQMAENAVQMVQRIPSPRGDKNGADINLALDALEMAFTHTHVNAFAIVSGDSDFIPLVNKLKEYGKTVFVVGGKAFTSTILQQNCHEFISFESLLADAPERCSPSRDAAVRDDRGRRSSSGRRAGPARSVRIGPIAATAGSVPLRSNWIWPCLWWSARCRCWSGAPCSRSSGLLKSTMLQLDSAFNERAYGASSFSDFVEKLKRAELVQRQRHRRALHYRAQGSAPQPERPALKPEDLLPPLRDVLENHRLEIENGCPVEDLAAWFKTEQPNFDISAYGFQEFIEFLNYAQDKTVVRLEPHEEQGDDGVSGRGVLSARRAAAAGAATGRRGRGGGIRAAALRRGPADDLRAQSAAA